MKFKTYLHVVTVFPITVAILASLGILIRSNEATQDSDLMIAAAFSIMSLIMAAAVLKAGKNILARFDSITRGMATVSDGDFAQRIESQNDTEVDGIADAFNTMNQQLKTSHVALQREAGKQEKAAAALRESNMMLSDALIKLKRAQQRALESERLGALSQMAGGIAHSFNNTLTPILGLSDYILAFPKALDDKDAIVEHMTTINEAVRSSRQQVARLSEYFRPTGQVRREAVDVNKVIEEVLESTQPLWKEQAETNGVTIDMARHLADVPNASASESDLHELISALVFNATEAMSESGRVTIATSTVDAMVSLSVSDTGDGMTAAVRSRCLEPFFSTKGASSAGMGLTVVSSIAQRHRGTISIDSLSDRGTTVTVALPVRTEADEDAVEPARDYGVVTGLDVLVVDDEEWTRKIYNAALSAGGHKVQSAADGPEALEMIRAGKFDIALIDRAMPRMSGDELARLAKKEASNMKIILVTGFGDLMNAEGKCPDGVDLVLGKPATLDEINAAMAHAMNSDPTNPPSAVSGVGEA